MARFSEILASRGASVRARVDFALTVAERALPALAGDEASHAVAEAALEAARRWGAGEDVRALDLYETHMEDVGVRGCLVEGEAETAAMVAATSAFCYVVWHAFIRDLDEGRVTPGEVYNDMAEVTEEVVDEVCDYAVEAGACTREWLAELADRLAPGPPAPG